MKLRKVLSLFVAFVMMFEVLPLASLATEIEDATENVEVSVEAVEEDTEEAEETVEEAVEEEETVLLGATADEEEDSSDESGIATASDDEEVTVLASGECGASGDNVTWTLTSDGTLTISGTGKMKDYSSTSSPGTWCSSYGSKIQSIIIEDGVTHIGDYAFSLYKVYKGNQKLKTVSIADSVTSIGTGAFYCCRNVTSITLPANLKSIGSNAFIICESLTSIYIPGSVTTISTGAFSSCYSLESVTIGEGCVSIGASAFSDCKKLTSVYIPNSVTSINYGAFKNCEKLEGITINDDNTHFTIVDGVVFNKSMTSLIWYPNASTFGQSTYTIPDSVTTIAAGAFITCDNLTSVYMSDNVTSIGYEAFWCCSNLANITLSNNITSIPQYAFTSCDSLAELELPYGLKTIGGSAFSYCEGLKSIVIPDSVTSIGTYAFIGCISLENVTLSNSITTISDNLFQGCTSLVSITIPDGVTSISKYAFKNCSKLESVTMTNSVTSCHEYAFYYCSKLTDIYFGGTVEEWNSVKIVRVYSVPMMDLEGVTIHCTDGTINSDGTVEYDEEETYTGFSPDVDGWSEVNHYWSFGYEEGYDIPLSAYFQHNFSAFGMWGNSLIQTIFNDWNGSCFGLSLLALANYNGQIDLSNYFSNGGDSLNVYGYEEVTSVNFTYKGGTTIGNAYTFVGNADIIRIIEKAQVSQFSSSFSSYFNDIEIGDYDEDYSEVIEFLENNPDSALLVNLNACNHTVVLTSQQVELNDSWGDEWVCYVLYDSNYPQLTNELEDAISRYSISTSFLALNTDTGEYMYITFNSDGTNNNKYSKYYFGWQEQIEFYDVSQLDDSYFDCILGTTLMDLICGTYVAVSNSCQVVDSTGEVMFDVADGDCTLYSEDVEYVSYMESIDADIVKGVLILPTNQYQIVCESETAICSYLNDESVIAYYVSGDATITVDEDSLSISVVNTSDADIEIEIALINSDGDTVAEATGTLETGTEFDIQLTEDENNQTIAVASTTSTPENITTELVVNGETTDEDYHYTTMANNDAELVAEAKTTLSSTDWTLTQSDVESATSSTTADKISTLIDAILAELGIDSNVTVTYTITDITEAIAGDATDVDGTDGSFTINFTISAGNESDTLTETGTITATAYVHTHTLTHVEAVDATCTAEGNTEYWYCSGCDKYYSDENAENEITLADTVTAKIAHNYEAVVTEPTCTEDGYTTYTCSACKDSYVADETVALGHNYESEVTKEATCTEAGIMTYTCTRGDDSYTAEISATGHSFNSEGVCEACGAKTGETGTTSTVTVDSDDTIFANVLPSGLVTSVEITVSNADGGTLVVSKVVEDSAYPYLVEHIADTLSFTLYNEAQGDDLISETNSFTITTTENNRKTLKKVTILFYGDVDYSGAGTSTVTMDFASASDLSSSDIYVLHYTGSYPTWEVVASTVTFGETLTVEFEASDYSPFVVLSVANASSGGSSSMIDILLKISANYSAVTEAIDRANALNPSDYENFSAVTEAINAVNWNLKAINQMTVNAYADAINTAIDSLVKTTANITEETVNIDEPIEDTNSDTKDDVF
ncbi:MAG: leucine-rich repeat protein [Oscillospiraceae bacterium]|nr:leucine-rich repeat protein [Oscillospiraceae bacterium]